MTESPRVSIGLPVYNGERYVANAIESILDQTYCNFELIISDNASTDGTTEICRAFEAQDRRIRYYRQPTNIGGSPNFNVCHALATGEYFKWASHDDLLEPGFVAKCVETLDAAPDAVLCQSLVRISDERDQTLETYCPVGRHAGDARPAKRLKNCLEDRLCLAVFGLIRSEALRGSVLMGSYIGSDRTLLVELALRGRFLLIDEVLFINRDHPERLSRITRRGTRQDLVVQLDTRLGTRADFSTWMHYGSCVRLIRKYVEKPAERLRCYGHLLTSLRGGWRGVYLLLEPLMAIEPRAYGVAKATKRSLGRVWRRSSRQT